MTRTILLAILATACSDPKPKSPTEPLLGTRTENAIRRFESSCDERFATVDPLAKDEPKPFARLRFERDVGDAERYKCEMSNLTSYGITFVFGHVLTVWIHAPSEAEMKDIFDRVFAEIVPKNVREQMRDSISDPKHFEVTGKKSRVEIHATDTSVSWGVVL